MPETRVIQLRVGRAHELPSSDWDVDCSVTLISIPDTNNTNILFETGGAWASEELAASLRKHALEPSAITHVLCSHGHSDHVGCLSMFPNAVQVVGRDVNSKAVYRNQRIAPSDRTIGGSVWDLHLPHVTLNLITTPGHTGHCVSLMGSIPDTDVDTRMLFVSNEGMETSIRQFALVGDLWENEEDTAWPYLSEMPELQQQSRDYVLAKRPDVIVPGHGPAFFPKLE